MSRVIFDFECAKHGIFEGSHPICPHMGCDSASVKKVFLKAPGFKSDFTKRADAGFKQSAEMYRQSDWKTSKEGDVTKANNRASELLWGDAGAAMVGRQSVDEIAAPASGFRSDGAPALGLVQEKGPSLMERTERTQESKVVADSQRKQLLDIAKAANAK